MTYLVSDLHAEALPFLQQVRETPEWQELYERLSTYAQMGALDEDAKTIAEQMHALDLTAYAAAGRARAAAVAAWRYRPGGSDGS